MAAATLRAARDACPHWELEQVSHENPAGIITDNPGPCCAALETAKRAQMSKAKGSHNETARTTGRATVTGYHPHITAGGRVIADCWPISSQAGRANAARLVRCWNALEPLTDAEVDALAERIHNPPADLHEAREGARRAAVEQIAHNAAHDFNGDKASRGETAGTLSDYVRRAFVELFNREPDSDEDDEILSEAESEAE